MKYYSSVVTSLFHLTGHKTAAIQINIFIVYMPFPFIQLQVLVQKRIFQIYFASNLCNFLKFYLYGEKKDKVKKKTNKQTKYTQNGVEKKIISSLLNPEFIYLEVRL